MQRVICTVWASFAAIACAMVLAAGCSTASRPVDSAALTNNIPGALLKAVRSVTNKYAPDGHIAICRITALHEGSHYALKGDVENSAAKAEALAAAARTGLDVRDHIELLPQKSLGDKLWGIATLSVVNVREQPANPAEVGTQMLTGEAFKVWKRATNWYLIQTRDRYVGWIEGGGFTNCTRQDVDAWNAAPHLIVTAYDERILEQPGPDAATVSDVVMGSQVKRISESGDWFHVGLADGRSGYLPKKSARDFADWKASRQPTAENIERTARTFLGRPYSWGGNSIRGMDCSGFTKFVYFMNGIDLSRNASEQCLQGMEVPLDGDFKNLKKGDLLFFGRRARRGRPESVNHAAIYLGDKLFIQSWERVQINSLDSTSPIADKRHIRSLLHARRVLPQ